MSNADRTPEKINKYSFGTCSGNPSLNCQIMEHHTRVVVPLCLFLDVVINLTNVFVASLSRVVFGINDESTTGAATDSEWTCGQR